MPVNISIRRLKPTDVTQAAQCATLWKRGLQQTVDQAPSEEKRTLYEQFFVKYVEEECAEGGSVGVDGRGLLEFYCPTDNTNDGSADSVREVNGKDSCMFLAAVVAEEAEEAANAIEEEGRHEKQHEKIVGMVGVKRGMDPKSFPTKLDNDYNVFSIHKMSVADEFRKKGVGKKLMAAVEVWARDRPPFPPPSSPSRLASTSGTPTTATEEAFERQYKCIRLYTANPIAASFYMNKDVGFVLKEMTEHYGVYEKKIV